MCAVFIRIEIHLAKSHIRMNVGCSENPSKLKDCIDEKIQSGELYTPNVIYILLYRMVAMHFIMKMCSPSTTNPSSNIQCRLSSGSLTFSCNNSLCASNSHILYHRRFVAIILRNDKRGKKRHRHCFVLRQYWTSNIQHHIVISVSPRCLPNSIIIIIIKCRQM